MLNAVLSLFRMILLILGGYEQVALENLALREQLAIFQRSVRHPKTRPTDRLFWVCLRRVWKEWKSALGKELDEIAVGLSRNTSDPQQRQHLQAKQRAGANFRTLYGTVSAFYFASSTRCENRPGQPGS